MTLYKWNTELYSTLNKYFPKCWIKAKHHLTYRNNFGELTILPSYELDRWIVNFDLYPAGMQIILNMGITEIKRFPGGDYSILPSPNEDCKHVREYRALSTGGQMGYYFPFKKRTLMFA